jgi:mercuric reductase
VNPVSNRDRFDLVILGSGSTAFAAAIRAAELGKRVAMTEARTVGGTCVNRGCLPSKNLIAAAGVLHTMRHPRYPGIQPVEPIVDFSALIRQKDALIAAYREKKYSSIVDDAAQIDVVHGAARFVDPHTVAVDGRVLTGEQILIATGSRPAVPSIAGLAAVPYLTSDLLTSQEPMELTTLPRSLLVLGGGFIGLELGQLFARLGTRVTVVHRGDRLLSDPAYEPETSRVILDALEEEGVTVLLVAKARRVRWEREIVLTVSRDDRVEDLHAEQLLVATGRQPNTDGIGIEVAGVALAEGGFVKVDGHLRTNVPHIWAAGDVIGRQTANQLATPVGAHDGVIVAQNALAEAGIGVDHAVVPRAIFTDPPIGLVGLSDEEANAAGFACRCNSIPMELVPRAAAVHDTRGVIKMVLEDESERVLGVQMVGQAAHEVIHEAAMGLRFGARRRDFVELIHVYPTMAEALKIVALSFEKDVTKLSCCAE